MIINMKYTNMYVIPDIFRYTKHAWAGLGGLTTYVIIMLTHLTRKEYVPV